MGLDMYLEKETYVKNWDYMKPEQRHEITVTKGGKPTNIKPERIKTIIEEVGYWRKANAIHNWFVENVQEGQDECQRSYVSAEQLQELLDLVNRILQDNSLAADLLPPQSGFFFGSTDIDEWYFQNLKDTKTILENVLAEKENQDDYGEIYYQASW